MRVLFCIYLLLSVGFMAYGYIRNFKEAVTLKVAATGSTKAPVTAANAPKITATAAKAI